MRRFLVRGLVAAALAVAMLSAPVASVRACSCMEFTLEGAIAAADIAFVGVLTDPKAAPELGGFEPITWRFEMERANRAVNGSIIEVSAPANDGANCGVGFGVDERWLVMASRSDGVLLNSSSCAGNVPIDNADPFVVAQIEALVPAIDAAAAAEPAASPSAASPTSAVETAGSSSGRNLSVVAIGAGIFAVILTAALYMWRRDRRS